MTNSWFEIELEYGENCHLHNYNGSFSPGVEIGFRGVWITVFPSHGIARCQLFTDVSLNHSLPTKIQQLVSVERDNRRKEEHASTKKPFEKQK